MANPVARRDAGEVAKEFRKTCTAPTAEAAFGALAVFATSHWGKQYPQGACV
jgi:transposase-like protein